MFLSECFQAIFLLIAIWTTSSAKKVKLYYYTDIRTVGYVFVPDRLIGRTTGFGPVNLGSSPSPAADC